MLVLSRKTGETIYVGDDIVITIVRIGPTSVRIGIDAPKHLNIARQELIHDSQCRDGSHGEDGD